MLTVRSPEEWRARLREALRDAQRARRPPAVAVLREAMAALDNAEAVDLAGSPAAEAGVIAGGVAGLGAGEVARRVLTAEQATASVEQVLHELREAAATYTTLGRLDEAQALELKAEVLRGLG